MGILGYRLLVCATVVSGFVDEMREAAVREILLEDPSFLRQPPLGVNASWVAEQVAKRAVFVARNGGSYEMSELDFLRKTLMAPFFKDAGEVSSARLAVKGDAGSSIGDGVPELSLIHI